MAPDWRVPLANGGPIMADILPGAVSDKHLANVSTPMLRQQPDTEILYDVIILSRLCQPIIIFALLTTFTAACTLQVNTGVL
ncbi:hypothetical protein NP493_85g05020 [Ridgeia piscesae]|uniref:Uncharacterized protein n=1 Tax=Ridgeia piscesae TaxID=27915 RepID=A0AAD9UI60_RIDPI|nr:hypothetical protein NP493_85g05020 [Ridgeia piscesae]